MYNWALSGLGKPGWLAAFLYTAAAALRLARFNTQLGIADKRYFQGLASPASAALVVGMVWVFNDFEIPGRQMDWYALGVTVAAGLLMVSNFRYRSFKDLDLKDKVPFVAVLLVVLVYMLVSIHPPQVLFGAAFLYAVSGPVGTLWSLRRHRARRAQKKQGDAD
jgi:CDP-diacylglycerol--serine O-phosphatidyltransferase